MIVKIVPIGNSRGIRIPAEILKQFRMDSQVELIVNEGSGSITLRPVRTPRTGWDEAFRRMRERSEDDLIIDDDIDLCEWEW
ncbi:MAG TPA: AbrB/MazE/SpoVT family DNA-binding domain-containing protein [Spirochaetota bacterium]|nr:AbrB/MazE/SpoVT family DNA-binding domain-containing protein [Spirochaetota bacterium]HOS39426.1 AbrB/MazE/SpoVT family DNA-binding domain-containing protein [Spirochaetota bacterium]HPI23152.1 AbrB/MazE/SpoVT family DNA-binding domain-containing protein [Spirochaetota bacterium]HPU87447.1 AbrB/MazE/SpoVT family DNA-binding domain-containing protein [Spirochaetota bacterium]